MKPIAQNVSKVLSAAGFRNFNKPGWNFKVGFRCYHLWEKEKIGYYWSVQSDEKLGIAYYNSTLRRNSSDMPSGSLNPPFKTINKDKSMDEFDKVEADYQAALELERKLKAECDELEKTLRDKVVALSNQRMVVANERIIRNREARKAGKDVI